MYGIECRKKISDRFALDKALDDFFREEFDDLHGFHSASIYLKVDEDSSISMTTDGMFTDVTESLVLSTDNGKPIEVFPWMGIAYDRFHFSIDIRDKMYSEDFEFGKVEWLRSYAKGERCGILINARKTTAIMNKY